MKLNFKGAGAVLLLSVMALFYSACNKVDNKPVATQPTTPATNMQIASSQVATNIYQSLSGTYGGVNVYGGLNIPLDNDKGHHGKNTQGCGFFIDSAITYSFNSGDTIKSNSVGSLYFYFLCDKHGNNTGFNVSDSLLTTGFAPGYTFKYDVTQQFNVDVLGNDYNKFSVDGAINSLVNLVYSKPSALTVSNTIYVTLHGVVLDLKKHDIIDGSANFVANGHYGSTSWSAEGTVTFIGDHKAKVTINGISFTIDLITGKIL